MTCKTCRTAIPVDIMEMHSASHRSLGEPAEYDVEAYDETVWRPADAVLWGMFALTGGLLAWLTVTLLPL